MFSRVYPNITREKFPNFKWLLRSAWMAQELLTTFTDELHGVLLQPSETSGRFTVRMNEQELFDRKAAGRFPDIKELKQLVRDAVAPGKALGHSDRKA